MFSVFPANEPVNHVSIMEYPTHVCFLKSGNRNAGATYARAVNSLKNLSYEITEDNAKTLHKGKTKVEGIGKVCHAQTSPSRCYDFLRN